MQNVFTIQLRPDVVVVSICLSLIGYRGFVEPARSTVSSLVSVVPFASRRASVSTNPLYRSFPFALAAAKVSSGKGGVVVSQKRTNSARLWTH